VGGVVSWCGFFLVGVSTIEQKRRKHDFEESLSGLMTTLFPTVHFHRLNPGRFKKHCNFIDFFKVPLSLFLTTFSAFA
jgi:hypothetical protein